jgi:hypothetical protein
MLDATIAFRIRPARAGAARRAIIVLRLPAWTRPSAPEIYRRQQIERRLECEWTRSRDAALLNFPLMNGY